MPQYTFILTFNLIGANMQLNISGHHLDITNAIKQHAQEKLEKIKHHFDHVININMILEIDNHEQKAEATIHVSGADLFAKASSDDMYTSIDQMVNKLDVQVRKHKEKLNNHRKN
jgi:putative sigma-54 modulation protein